ncbi:glycoside hydrolase family 108 protein [Carboxylicivirga linearis]|uniref:Secretion activator protein n=1 Tax=Carboxylicivirga linearis TaxID=1628157 RepID=A0ABS5K0S6_9BACT|nr:glycosyl hydrolase 108 family protein [Carboxylicivirga linearis]MBS2100714.1 hypothetical protein [Carboxylicivirga linearis]
MARFEKAFEKTLKHEGGYSNHPKDKGGETYKGIARNFWPDWGGWRIIDQLKSKYPNGNLFANLDGSIDLNEFVESFYRYHFWDKLNCVHMPQEIADELFDTSVNMGIGYGAKCLQNALNKLNRNQKDYPDLIVDGGIGNKSIDALEAYFDTSRFGSRNKEKLTMWLLKWMNYYQLKKYDEITNRNLEQEIFVPGWTERT